MAATPKQPSPPTHRFRGQVYRAHHPRWAYLPTSGEGAARHGGRFNRPGRPALYTALDPTTAWMEAQQGLPFKAQPMTLVVYRIDCAGVADLTDPDVLDGIGIVPADLDCAWEDLADRGRDPPTWRIAEALIAADVRAAIVPSFAPGANAAPGTAIPRNLVFWQWSETPPCAVRAIDDFGRLPRDAASWD
ncbi:RES family NAD+ phosphorylase [Thiocapsa bogorovii]|uniref:RES family NAD+ phosphorylase n=1 Tax=Thiocapsa bogorovii TaxID=521689 RepID=UPI001E548AB7|nr:RES domain-containing protein [Thiocapsa bogorovii]UHD16538.1 RES domain-containing protein [Thiocapsa bogorovii]